MSASAFNRPLSPAAATSVLVNVPWHWLESLLISLLAVIGVDVFLGFVLLLTGKAPLLTSSLALLEASIAGNFIIYTLSRGIGFFVILWFVRRRGGGLRNLGFRKFRIDRAVGIMILATGLLLIGAMGLFILIENIAPNVNLQQEQQIVFKESSNNIELILSFISLVIVAPVVEEVIFRGFLFPSFSRRFGIMAAAVITSLLFGIVHMQINVAIVTFVMGLLLCWLYYKTRSLWPAILFHSIKNYIAFTLLFLS